LESELLYAIAQVGLTEITVLYHGAGFERGIYSQKKVDGCIPRHFQKKLFGADPVLIVFVGHG
jgi:hypothetical protein